jgi:hypothetical protein
VPYSKICDTFRPRVRHGAATRTDLGGKTFVDLFEPSSARNRFVLEHISKRGPAGVEYRFGHVRLGQGCSVDIADCNVIELPDNPVRKLVVEVAPSGRDLRMDLSGLSPLSRPLGCRQLIGQLVQVPRICNLLAGRQCREVFQAEIDAHSLGRRPRVNIVDFNGDVEEPVAARVAREVRAVFDFPARQVARIKDPEGVAGEAERVAFALEFPTLERHPSKRALAPIPKERPALLGPAFGVLLAHRVDSAGVQAELLAAARGELVEVKPCEPLPAPLERVLLPIVAIVPDEVHRAALLIKQAVQGLYAVSVNKDQGSECDVNGYTSDVVPSYNVSRPIAFSKGSETWGAPAARRAIPPDLKDGVSRAKLMRSQATPCGAQSDVRVVGDEGDVRNAVCAMFGEGDSHVRYALGKDDKIWLLGIYSDGEVSGRAMVAWLKASYGRVVRVAEVAMSAVGFWEKMLSEGLIEDWSPELFAGRAVPMIEPVQQTASAGSSPLLAYHATTAPEDFNRFEFTEDVGFHFGSIEAAHNRLEQITDPDDEESIEHARLIPCLLHISKSLRLDDCFTWEPGDTMLALQKAGVLVGDEFDRLFDGGFLDHEMFREIVEAAGYDSIVYSNLTERGGDSYIVLDPARVEFAIARQPAAPCRRAEFGMG